MLPFATSAMPWSETTTRSMRRPSERAAMPARSFASPASTARSAAIASAQCAPHREERPIYPGVLMEAMNAVLDDDTMLASDVGNCQMWTRTCRRIAHPEAHVIDGLDVDHGRSLARDDRGGLRRSAA